jgi:hypothetical protein
MLVVEAVEGLAEQAELQVAAVEQVVVGIRPVLLVL